MATELGFRSSLCFAIFVVNSAFQIPNSRSLLAILIPHSPRMEIFSISILRLLVFLLILIRISAFVLSAPIFASIYAPARLKIGLSFLLSVILLPVVEKANFSPPTKLLLFLSFTGGFVLGYVIVVFKEMSRQRRRRNSLIR